MATYMQIQDWVKARNGRVVETCWIAHVKSIHGLPVRQSPNRKGEDRAVPCPPNKQPWIEQALRHFEMIR